MPTPDALSQDALRLLETVLGARLPDAYRDFLASTNGALTGQPDFPIPSTPPNASTLVAWLRVNATPPHDELVLVARQAAQSLGRGMIPIGRDAGGALVCLSITGPHRGAVWFENTGVYDMQSRGPAVTEWAPAHMIWLCDDFGAFQASLSSDAG